MLQGRSASVLHGGQGKIGTPFGMFDGLPRIKLSRPCFCSFAHIVRSACTSASQLVGCCRLLNNPLETACEVNIIASLTQLKVLEFGLIFDGSSQHHDVPRALEQVSNLTCLQVRVYLPSETAGLLKQSLEKVSQKLQVHTLHW